MCVCYLCIYFTCFRTDNTCNTSDENAPSTVTRSGMKTPAKLIPNFGKKKGQTPKSNPSSGDSFQSKVAKGGSKVAKLLSLTPKTSQKSASKGRLAPSSTTSTDTGPRVPTPVDDYPEVEVEDPTDIVRPSSLTEAPDTTWETLSQSSMLSRGAEDIADVKMGHSFFPPPESLDSRRPDSGHGSLFPGLPISLSDDDEHRNIGPDDRKPDKTSEDACPGADTKTGIPAEVPPSTDDNVTDKQNDTDIADCNNPTAVEQTGAQTYPSSSATKAAPDKPDVVSDPVDDVKVDSSKTESCEHVRSSQAKGASETEPRGTAQTNTTCPQDAKSSIGQDPDPLISCPDQEKKTSSHIPALPGLTLPYFIW